jgi:hypothetical protein
MDFVFLFVCTGVFTSTSPASGPLKISYMPRHGQMTPHVCGGMACETPACKQESCRILCGRENRSRGVCYVVWIFLGGYVSIGLFCFLLFVGTFDGVQH